MTAGDLNPPHFFAPGGRCFLFHTGKLVKNSPLVWIISLVQVLQV